MTIIVETNPNYEVKHEQNGIFHAHISNAKWLFRVHLYRDQYIVGFPKFATIGIGFLLEKKSGNTNLPFDHEITEIVNHIWINHHYKAITKEQVQESIEKMRGIIQEYLATKFITASFGCMPEYCPTCPRDECKQACKKGQHRWNFNKRGMNPNCNVCGINREDKTIQEKFIFD